MSNNRIRSFCESHPKNEMKDAQGRFRTLSLFWEYRKPEVAAKYPPLFTIKEYDHTVDGVTYLSLKKLYMDYDHVPGFEYEFAMDVFGCWEHWQRLCSEGEAKKLIADWRAELEIKLKSQSIAAMIRASKDNDAKGVAAAKYLAEKGYELKRGRPSKEEVEREKKIAAGVRDTLDSDMERLGITVINGGR